MVIAQSKFGKKECVSSYFPQHCMASFNLIGAAVLEKWAFLGYTNMDKYSKMLSTMTSSIFINFVLFVIVRSSQIRSVTCYSYYLNLY